MRQQGCSCSVCRGLLPLLFPGPATENVVLLMASKTMLKNKNKKNKINASVALEFNKDIAGHGRYSDSVDSSHIHPLAELPFYWCASLSLKWVQGDNLSTIHVCLSCFNFWLVYLS